MRKKDIVGLNAKTQKKKDKFVIAIAVVVALAAIILIALIILLVKMSDTKEQLREAEILESTEITDMTADTFRPKEEILKEDTYTGKIQFGNEIVTLPCLLGELIDAGAEIDDETYSAFYLLEAGGSIDVSVKLYGMEFKIGMENQTGETKKLYECMAVSLEDVTNYMITFPGGITPGVSYFDDVIDAWGEGHVTNSDDEETLTATYYRDAIAPKDIYAYESGGKNVNDMKGIIDVGGFSYAVSYDRVSGLVTDMTATFKVKKGVDVFEPITYHFDGVDATFDILSDAYNIGNDMWYCIENIDGTDYIIAYGLTSASYDESGAMMNPDTDADSSEQLENTESSSGLNEQTRNLLTYSEYDFSDDYDILKDTDTLKSYFGEKKNDSVYFAIDAEVLRKDACSFAFYLHPRNSTDRISFEAVEYMHKLEDIARSSLEFD